ncbi:MAG TPA: heparinase II/III family protein [Clostridia bacterium]|nr:heparinase II/III family protein [Clostridia bacterium]
MTRHTIFRGAAALWLCSVTTLLASQPVDETQILERLSKAPPHPRLLWTAKDDASVRDKLTRDPRLKSAWEAVRITANHMLDEKPVVYRKDGRRLLGRSREALSRINHLGFAWRITGDKKYAERAVAEMEAAAAMPDWNPSHFLDVAEMTLALAVGYDWFYDQLSPEQRARVRLAIEKNGLGPYLKPGSRHGWERGGNNWNQVCHAGMVAGALALLEDDPKRAAEVIRRAVAGLPSSMNVYDPDGNYPEGPGYWNYGTTFNVLVIAMLESAAGTDFGISQNPGFLKTGEFPLQIMGPTLRTYPFSDCGTGSSFAPAMPWFAARNQRPDLMWFEWKLLERDVARVKETKGRAAMDRIFPMAILWAQPGQEPQAPKQLAWLARGQNPLAVFRSSWTDPNAVFLAIKAGTPSASHAHMDIGSFVLDAAGVRWSLDLGAQDYNALEQRGIGLWNNRQDSERWKIFRYHNRAHSTLLVDDAGQLVTSKAPIKDFSPDPENFSATVDLTETYSGQLARAVRRFALRPEREVVIEDSLTAKGVPAKVRWGMVTPATLKPGGQNSAWLEANGKRLRLRVISPENVTIKTWPANPPPNDYDAPNPGVSIVGFEVPLAAGQSATLKVSLQCP